MGSKSERSKIQSGFLPDFRFEKDGWTMIKP